ncbi:RimK family alpha-L-glutamate ligase [Virgibacillus sp. CBA3643]|uniref:ATP-grasp domain-containing protein n=1 Tax=Virgibacillus sp. CBA3643 TaxID=2942278 RepID=UPI0035A2E78B
MSKIYVLHENNEWTDHLINRLEELQLPYEDWLLENGKVDLTSLPPDGVFYNRMSASSHTRGNRFAPELTSAVLPWLEQNGRTVINGSRALQLELSKVLQYLELEKFGIKKPRTVAAVGKDELLKAAESFEGKKFITKHNRAGKGLGVKLFQSVEALRQYVEGEEFEEPVDGVTLIQEYIESPESFITRCEFVGGKFLYAVRVDTSEGFELCPADACSIEDQLKEEELEPFQVREGFNHPVLEKYERMLTANDINTNTNYNSDAEAKSGKFGMLEVAKYLGEELERVNGAVLQ